MNHAIVIDDNDFWYFEGTPPRIGEIVVGLPPREGRYIVTSVEWFIGRPEERSVARVLVVPEEGASHYIVTSSVSRTLTNPDIAPETPTE